LYDLLRGDVAVEFDETDSMIDSSITNGVAEFLRICCPHLSLADIDGLDLDDDAVKSPEFVGYHAVMRLLCHNGSRAHSIALARLLLQGMYLKTTKNLRIPLKFNMYKNWTYFFIAPMAWAADLDLKCVAAVAAANGDLVRSYAASVRSWKKDISAWAEMSVTWIAAAEQHDLSHDCESMVDEARPRFCSRLPCGLVLLQYLHWHY